jgi:hypothetical protein
MHMNGVEKGQRSALWQKSPQSLSQFKGTEVGLGPPGAAVVVGQEVVSQQAWHPGFTFQLLALMAQPPSSDPLVQRNGALVVQGSFLH